MKKVRLITIASFFLSTALSGVGQGTFIYDQQSVTNDNKGGEGAPVIQQSQPMGQSFTPMLNSVGFIRLWTGDSAFNGLGAVLYVNLRSDSITGPILGSTQPVFLPDRFATRTNFIFVNPVSVTPGTTYYFQPVVQSGDTWQIVDDLNFNYPGGTAFGGGQPAPPFDLWFREGIIIPEPTGVSLLLLGMGLFAWRQRRWRKS